MNNQRIKINSDALNGAIDRAKERPHILEVKQQTEGVWDHGDTWLGDWGRNDSCEDSDDS